MPKHENFEIAGTDGQELNARVWLPDREPQGLLCIVHGLGEHSGRYHELATFFTESGLAVYAADLHGHGNSPGKRGHAISYQLLLDDVEAILRAARVEYNDLPMFLYGHSFGGGLVANFLQKRKTSELSGAILSSPWLTLVQDPPKWQRRLASVVHKISPALTTRTGLDPQHLSKDPTVVQAYEDDPLTHDRISLKLFFAAEHAGRQALESTEALEVPLLLIHGEEDQICDPKATGAFARKYPEKTTMKCWPGVYHEPHHDLEKQEIMEYMRQWVIHELDVVHTL